MKRLGIYRGKRGLKNIAAAGFVTGVILSLSFGCHVLDLQFSAKELKILPSLSVESTNAMSDTEFSR